MAALCGSKRKRKRNRIGQTDEEYPRAIVTLSETSNLNGLIQDGLPRKSLDSTKRLKTISGRETPCTVPPLFHSFIDSGKNSNQQRLTQPNYSGKVRTSKAAEDKYAVSAVAMSILWPPPT